MTHIPFNGIRIHRSKTGATAAAAQLALVLARLGRGTAQAFTSLPDALLSLFAMAYVDPFSPRRSRDDRSNPERY